MVSAMASLKHIAQLANVTAATVSRALRGHPNVDPATSTHIRKIAARIGYVPNPRISSLMSYVRSSSGTSFRETLAFIWPDAGSHEVRNTYQLGRFESGASERARLLGYGLDFFYPHDDKVRKWDRLRTVLRARNIRGLIWGPVLRSSHAHLTMSLESYAAAAIGEAFVHPRLSHTRFDHFVGIRTALHQLKRQGCRRIGFALDRNLNARATPILLASFSAYSGVGTRTSRELCYEADVLEPAGLLAWALEIKPDAILLSHDINLLAKLPRHPQVTWPLKMASLNRLSKNTPFSGIDQRQDLIASHACDLVLEQLNRNEFGTPKHAKIVLVEGEWRNHREDKRAVVDGLA